MKQIIVIIFFLVASISLFSQNKQGKLEDIGRLSLAVFVPNQIEGLTDAAHANLENKLNQIVSSNGLGGSILNQRFVMSANVAVVTKDITSSAPPMQAYTLEVTLYIGDGYDGTVFSNTTLNLKGVGETETKAYMAALKNIKSTDARYKDFIEKGKNKIIEYYNTKCDFIIKEAETLAGQNEFDAAISHLLSVPDVCKDCYFKAMDAAKPIYKQKIDRECKLLLQEAQAVWTASQSYEAAAQAGSLLASIDPDASCFKEAQALFKKIEARVKQIDDREWKYILKEQAQESERIAAYKAIGVAYGSHQPQNVTYKSFW